MLTSQKKILLITAGTNDDKNSSWLVYQKFIEQINLKHGNKIEVVCFSPKYRREQSTLKETIFRTIFRKKLVAAIMSRVIKQFNYYVVCFYAHLYTKPLLKIINQKEIDILWLHSDLLTTKIISNIRKVKNIPYHYTIYDDPFTNKFYSNFKEKAQKLFRDVLFKAKSIDTPTMYLANYYRENNYISDNCIYTESLVGLFKNATTFPIIRSKISKICLAGSIYGIDAFENFLQAIYPIINANNIEVHVITNVPKIYIKYFEKNYPYIHKLVIFKNFVPEKNIINKLQEYDLLYLPMLFDPKHRFKTNSSFPSKTHNYLASGVPIIVHTPLNSSLDLFFKSNNIGCIINSLDLKEIESKFLQIMEEPERKRLSKEIQLITNKLAENKHLDQLYALITTNV